MKFLIAISILVTFPFCCVLAEQVDSVSEYLCEYGTNLYKRGNVDDAVHELKKSLMADNDNVVAKKYLQKIARDEQYREYKRTYLHKSETPKKTLISLEENPGNKSYLQKNEDSVEDNSRELAEKDAFLQALKNELIQANDQLTQAKEQLSQQLTQTQGEFSKDIQIKELQDKIKVLESSSSEQITEYRNKIDTLEKDLTFKNDELAKVTTSFTKDKEQLSQQLTQIDSSSQEKDTQIKSLQDQVKSLENSSIQITEYKNKIDTLEKDLVLKDNKLNEVAANFNKDKEQMDLVLNDRGRELAEKDAFLQALKNELSQAKEQLNQQLAQVKDQLVQMDKTSGVKDAQIKELQDQVKSLGDFSSGQLAECKTKINALEKDLIFKDNKLKEATSSFKKDKEQLGTALKDQTKELAKKDSSLQALRSELAKTKEQFDTKFAKLNKSPSSVQLVECRKKVDALEKEKQSLLVDKESTVSSTNAQIAKLKETMDNLRKSLQSEIDNYEAKLVMAKKGVVVTVLTDIVFDSGSARLSYQGKIILQKISDVLVNEHIENNILIEGHTDDEPIKISKWKSNWELSCARALTVLEALINTSDIDPTRFSIAGYGEYSPVSDNLTAAGRKQNRRVEIVIQPEMIKVKNNQ